MEQASDLQTTVTTKTMFPVYWARFWIPVAYTLWCSVCAPRATWKSSHPSSSWQHFKPLKRPVMSLHVPLYCPLLSSHQLFLKMMVIMMALEINIQHFLVYIYIYYMPDVILSSLYILTHKSYYNPMKWAVSPLYRWATERLITCPEFAANK